jgi:hypothetical protein
LNEHYFNHPFAGVPDAVADRQFRARRNAPIEDITFDDDFDLEDDT